MLLETETAAPLDLVAQRMASPERGLVCQLVYFDRQIDS
jgi:hypothetical protein